MTYMSMTGEQAEKIINDFGGAVASLPEKQAVLPLSSLPYPKAVIRYAYFIYIEELVKSSLLTDDYANALVQTYALIDSRFKEDSERINELHKQYVKSEKAREALKEYGGLTVGLPSVEAMQELLDFIEVCYQNAK